jgi:hypothetical protein
VQYWSEMVEGRRKGVEGKLEFLEEITNILEPLANGRHGVTFECLIKSNTKKNMTSKNIERKRKN